MVNEWGVCDNIVKKSNHVYNKYLRSVNYKEGSSESQKRVLGCPSEKHSYDNKTGHEDLFVAVGWRGDGDSRPQRQRATSSRRAWHARDLRP